MKKIFVTAFLTLIISSSVFSQTGPDGSKPQGENLQVPEGWNWRFDRPNPEIKVGADAESADIFFVNMTPGWHITSGTAGIYYHEDNVVEGDFTLSSKIYLFDTNGRNREAFGLFIGGSNLEDENQSYIYFLIRNTGEYLIKKRDGTETANIQGWTKVPTMNLFTTDTESSAENDLEVSVKEGKIHFKLNGQILTSIDKGELKTDGVYGFRVNHSINLHISSLKVK